MMVLVLVVATRFFEIKLSLIIIHETICFGSYKDTSEINRLGLLVDIISLILYDRDIDPSCLSEFNITAFSKL